MARFKNILLFILFTFIIHSCDGFKISKSLFEFSERAKYERQFKGGDSLMTLWKSEFSTAFANQLHISAGYSATVNNEQHEPFALGYSINLKHGDRIFVETSVSKNLNNKIFIDIGTDLSAESNLRSEVIKEGVFSKLIEKDGDYKVIIQPEIEYQGNFTLKIYSQPSYIFPVVGKANKDAQSFWGASRDGGNRSHEGVDIFASRGTPAIAATDGSIIRTGDHGLGGKQVWLRDNISGNALYYAHLDSVMTESGKQVKLGDTLGLVGNTGNAKGGATHLHFGIYSTGGAVDAYPFIRKRAIPKQIDVIIPSFKILKGDSNIRKGPGMSYDILYTNSRESPSAIIAGNGDWFHIRTKDGKEGFVSVVRMK